MAKVFVVTGGDFPDCVFANEKAAQEYVTAKREEENAKSRCFHRIYWGYYVFDLKS